MVTMQASYFHNLDAMDSEGLPGSRACSAKSIIHKTSHTDRSNASFDAHIARMQKRRTSMKKSVESIKSKVLPILRKRSRVSSSGPRIPQQLRTKSSQRANDRKLSVRSPENITQARVNQGKVIKPIVSTSLSRNSTYLVQDKAGYEDDESDKEALYKLVKAKVLAGHNSRFSNVNLNERGLQVFSSSESQTSKNEILTRLNAGGRRHSHNYDDRESKIPRLIRKSYNTRSSEEDNSGSSAAYAADNSESDDEPMPQHVTLAKSTYQRVSLLRAKHASTIQVQPAVDHEESVTVSDQENSRARFTQQTIFKTLKDENDTVNLDHVDGCSQNKEICEEKAFDHTGKNDISQKGEGLCSSLEDKSFLSFDNDSLSVFGRTISTEDSEREEETETDNISSELNSELFSNESYRAIETLVTPEQDIVEDQTEIPNKKKEEGPKEAPGNNLDGGDHTAGDMNRENRDIRCDAMISDAPRSSHTILIDIPDSPKKKLILESTIPKAATSEDLITEPIIRKKAVCSEPSIICQDQAVQVNMSGNPRRVTGGTVSSTKHSQISLARSLTFSMTRSDRDERATLGFEYMHNLMVVPEVREEPEGELRDVFMEHHPGGSRPGQRHSEDKCCENCCLQCKKWFKKRKGRHAKEDIPVFKEHIKRIEGQFGCGVVSFFVFTRWVMLLNLAVAMVWLCFVILPQAVYISYLAMSQSGFYIRNFIDGANALSKSWMFYGNYEADAGPYSISLFYLLAILFTYFGGFFFILKSIAVASRHESGSSVDTRHTFSALLFSSWDHSVTNKGAVRQLNCILAQTFRDQIHHLEIAKELQSWARRDWTKIIARRCLAWLMTSILIGVGCVTIVYLVQSDLVLIFAKLGYHTTVDSPAVIYGPTLIFMFINSTVPQCVYQLPKIEKYVKGVTEVNVTIGRVFVLRIVNLGALVASLYIKVKHGESKECAGNLIGQEMYRLVVLDTIVKVITNMVPTFIYFYWTRKKKQFMMPKYVLAIVYRQALIWVGTIVCPVLPLIGAASMAVYFGSNYMVVSRAMRPPEKRVNQARSSVFFMALLAATLILLIIPITLVIGSTDMLNLGETGQQSVTFCGPFGNRTMLDTVGDMVMRVENTAPFIATFLKVLVSTKLLIPLILIMLSILHFQHVQMTWERNKRKLVSAELKKEREENKDLMKKLHLYSSD